MIHASNVTVVLLCILLCVVIQSKEELQIACAERGMRSVGLTKFGLTRQLQQWLGTYIVVEEEDDDDAVEL